MSALGPHQVYSDCAAQQEAQVDVDGVVLVLDDPGQATDDATHDEGEDQQRLQQLRGVGQRAVEVHLWRTRIIVFIDLWFPTSPTVHQC